MRDAVQAVLDVGQAADWITPMSGMIRGGRVFVVSQAEISVAEVQALLSGAGVHRYAEQVLPADGDRLYVFRVADDDAPAVRSLLGYAEPAAAATTSGSAWWMWAALAMVFMVAFTLGMLWAAAGGAL